MSTSPTLPKILSLAKDTGAARIEREKQPPIIQFTPTSLREFSESLINIYGRRPVPTSE